MSIPLSKHDALLLVDVQNDFCPGGLLAVAEGDQVVPVLNRWIQAAASGDAMIVASRCWHPENHCSFEARGGPWPEHCVQESAGADLHPDLRLPENALLISKGQDPEQDQYSAFDGTGLGERLRREGISRVWVGGLALDVCVRATVLDALKEGFEVHVIVDGTRAVNIEPDDGETALKDMAAEGAVLEQAA